MSGLTNMWGIVSKERSKISEESFPTTIQGWDVIHVEESVADVDRHREWNPQNGWSQCWFVGTTHQVTEKLSVMASYPFFFFFHFLTFYWSIVDLQCCDNFCHTTKRFSYTCTRIHSFSESFSTKTLTEYWVEFPELYIRYPSANHSIYHGAPFFQLLYWLLCWKKAY